jgi:hypothetical protein
VNQRGKVSGKSGTSLDSGSATGTNRDLLVTPIRQQPALAGVLPAQHAFDGHYTSQQHNTHIRDLREICYSWHPWHGRAVWVHATLVKRGRAVAHCSLEDIQTSRVLEVPLWMLDVVSCCKTRVSQPGFASAQSLRELKEVLQSAPPRAHAHDTPETQPRYLLDAGGVYGGIDGPAEIEPTPVVCLSARQPALDRSDVRCPTKNGALAGAAPEAASRGSRGENRRGGAR